jgi:hypothetical protein
LVLPIIAYTLFNKIRDKGKIVYARKQGCRGRRRNGPNIVCTYELKKQIQVCFYIIE